MRRRLAAPSVALALILLAAGCIGGPSASVPAPPSPSAPAASVGSPDEAAQLVLSSDPRFKDLDIPKRDPDLIGGCCWYEAVSADGGYAVTIEIGWGDCMSGCIERHQWTYAVTADGTVTATGEHGTPVPPGPLPPVEGG